jgi:hypothetical protein
VRRRHGWGLAVAVVAAAGLALPAPALPCTSAKGARAGKGLVQRPTARTGAYAYARGVPQRFARGRNLVFHWTTSGPDAPPAADVDGDRIPDYVELTAAAAEQAWRKYTSRSPAGFRLRAPLCDRAGPDRRPDVYIKRLRSDQGLALSGSRAAGGPFMLVAPDLDVSPVLSSRSLNVVVAHELFHLVQFTYVPRGMPRWISEGTANALALYGIDPSRDLRVNAPFAAQTDPWLKQPWTSVFAAGNNCTRCYGGGLWWIYALAQSRPDVLRLFFERLAGSRRIGTGWQQLAAAFRRTAGVDFDQVFGRIANRLFRDGFPVTARFTINASAPGATPDQQILGMSTHYVPIEVPATVQTLEVTVQARGGARFLNRMILGGPTGSDIAWLPQTDRTRLVFRIQLTDPAQRQLLLIVTNARSQASRYAVSWRVP